MKLRVCPEEKNSRPIEALQSAYFTESWKEENCFGNSYPHPEKSEIVFFAEIVRSPLHSLRKSYRGDLGSNIVPNRWAAVGSNTVAAHRLESVDRRRIRKPRNSAVFPSEVILKQLGSQTQNQNQELICTLLSFCKSSIGHAVQFHQSKREGGKLETRFSFQIMRGKNLRKMLGRRWKILLSV